MTKKIIFSVQTLGKETRKTTGVGYICGDDLLYPASTKAGKPYIRVLNGAVKSCHAVPNTTNQFAGMAYELVEVEVPVIGNDGKERGKEKIQVTRQYIIWYKLAD